MKSTAKQGIKNSSPNEFASTMNRLYAPLCFAANRFLNDKSASEDIVQEAFARLWELVSKEKEIESIDNYMYMLVHNLSLEWLRKLKLQEKFVNSRSLKEVNIFNVIVETDVALQIIKEIEKLPPRSKQVMQLAFQGLDNQQIAQEMNISVNSVKTLKYKSIDKLKAISKLNVFKSKKTSLFSLSTRIIVVKKEKRHTFWVCLSQLKLFPLLSNHHNQVFCLFPEIIFVIDFQGHITIFTGLQSIGISRMDRK